MDVKRCFWAGCLAAAVCSSAFGATHALLLNNATLERVVVAHHDELNPTNGITIELWIRRENLATCQTLVGKGFQTAWWFGICGHQLRYYSNGSGTAITGSTSVPANEWTHVAVTFDGTTRRYYINGELDIASVTPGPLGSNLQAMGIGGEGASATFPSGVFPFSGLMSEVRIWKRARSETEIRQFMHQQIINPQTDLVGVWSLENSSLDRFGEFFSVLYPGASFSSLDSPAIPHTPLEIPNTGSIVADGSCADGGYTTARTLPAWYDPVDRPFGVENPQEVLIGASAQFIYVCLTSRTQLTDPIYTVEIDTTNHGTNLLQNDDYRFRYWPGNDGLKTFRGSTISIGGTPTSTWGSAVSNPIGLFAAETGGVEFVTDFEMVIPRSIFTDPGAVFRIRTSHNFLSDGLTEKTIEWPFDSSSIAPLEWQEAQVNLSLISIADAGNPNVWMSIRNDRLRADEPVVLGAQGRDDVDVELIEVLVDGVVVESHIFSEPDNGTASLVHSQVYGIGNHTHRARVYDHVGREAYSRQGSFRVLVDGNPPGIVLRSSPHDPLPGQAVTLSAYASDPSGIQSIMIRNVIGSLSPGFKRCDFAGGNESEECIWVVTPHPAMRRLRVDAVATDSEGFLEEAVDRTILFGNNGVDSDNDGLSDEIEAGLCTDPNSPDTDLDGLSDSWEVEGIRFTLGLYEYLPDYGVNPCWKNVLLQLDYETGAMPPGAAIDNLRNRYRDHQITTYVELRERSQPTAYSQSHLTATTAVYQMGPDGYYFAPNRHWAFYYAYQRNRTGRSYAWGRTLTVENAVGESGYCFGGGKDGEVCRSDFDCPGGGSCQAGCNSGPNEAMSCSLDTDCPLNDGSFGNCQVPCVTTPGAPGTACRVGTATDYLLFHELGHTVGLGHGGRVGTRTPTSVGGFVRLDSDWNNQNYKPGHRSVMNYAYSLGEICMEPIPNPIPDGFTPTLVGLVTYLDTNFPTQNENSLGEGDTLVFSTTLQDRDCSHASPTAIPVVKFTCESGGTKYENLSDGSTLLARRAEGGPWDFDPPAHAPGIDWNCNGVISSSVSSNINGPGSFDGDGYFNDDSWDLESNLTAADEFSQIPNPVSCQIMYAPNCSDRASSCYPWPADYQTLIMPLDTGVNPIDCRNKFLANRAGDCGGGSDSDFGTGICPAIDPDVPALAEWDTSTIGESNVLAANGAPFPQHDDPVVEFEPAPPLPGAEVCDLADNDFDGEVDEGCRDTDSDGIPDVIDNCVTIANAEQADRDFDGLGEACQFPGLNNLSGTWDANQGIVKLTWTVNSIPSAGVVVYRHSAANPDAIYLGSSYPTTEDVYLFDPVPTDGFYFYAVLPLNLNGEEGEAVIVSVQVGEVEVIFEDSFEDP